jgi:NAD(P)H-dependent flavin oxidoreductase YrpB (nitropropane dioxygenase family)
MTDESGAHAEYKRRLADATQTVLTELFGFGWGAAPHRVVANAATARWLTADPRGPRWVRAINQVTTPVLSCAPSSMQFRLADRLAATQSPARPFFSPASALAGGPNTLVEAGPLYAGESVARISDVRPAAELVHELGG